VLKQQLFSGIVIASPSAPYPFLVSRFEIVPFQQKYPGAMIRVKHLCHFPLTPFNDFPVFESLARMIPATHVSVLRLMGILSTPIPFMRVAAHVECPT
jgi:hypothetical protein